MHNLTIAQAICYVLAVEFLILIGVDIWLGVTGRQMITDAIRIDNSVTGWIVAGIVFTIVGHLFVLPYVILIWHKVSGR